MSDCGWVPSRKTTPCPTQVISLELTGHHILQESKKSKHRREGSSVFKVILLINPKYYLSLIMYNHNFHSALAAIFKQYNSITKKVLWMQHPYSEATCVESLHNAHHCISLYNTHPQINIT